MSVLRAVSLVGHGALCVRREDLIGVMFQWRDEVEEVSFI